MLITGLIFAGLAAILHCYIFVMESLRWTTPRVRATFGIESAEVAEITKPLAFNQGFYNLFLAIVVYVGIAFVFAGGEAVGLALIFVGIGSMFAAAMVLLLSDRSKARAAITQGTLPLLGLIFTIIALVIR
ncbi:DUF1304 domain-containing protein [Mycetocola tolaasinivorans]|uniref:DUF1304 domain-containing protein n=1 Tax=Mycetocola tolaasinivorans TaxID=76635 RepID=A0A3L7AC67_9MICO|nr:DUF1304 domain-containing protein [Mycetocola tolaasinivorans]RLP76982.1 DUF1304 domain-containing protein [Mycetocola tolaasinivorans]